jgi:hypothetical protein
VTELADAPIPAAVRAGVVAVVPLTIIGGLFMLVAHPPLPALEAAVAPWATLLDLPIAATFGLLALFVCLAVAHDLGGRFLELEVRSIAVVEPVERHDVDHPGADGEGPLRQAELDVERVAAGRLEVDGSVAARAGISDTTGATIGVGRGASKKKKRVTVADSGTVNQ